MNLLKYLSFLVILFVSMANGAWLPPDELQTTARPPVTVTNPSIIIPGVDGRQVEVVCNGCTNVEVNIAKN